VSHSNTRHSLSFSRRERAKVSRVVTNMSKLTRKGAAAAAATTTMDDDDAEGERNSNSKVYGKRKGSKNKMDKLYSSFKSNLTKKSTHSGGGGEGGGGGGGGERGGKCCHRSGEFVRT